MRIPLSLPLILPLTNCFLLNYKQLHDISDSKNLISQIGTDKEKLNAFSVEKRRLYHTLNGTANDLFQNNNEEDSEDEQADSEEQDGYISHVSVTAPAHLPQICKGTTHLIETTNDLYSLQDNCKELFGDLIVTPTYDNSMVDLGGIQNIYGNFIIENSNNIINIKAESLMTISHNFVLKSLTSLVDINTPLLRNVNSIDWEILPILGTIDLHNDILINQDIIISDTSLANIDQISKVKVIDIFNINNNRFLETIKSNINTVNTQFTIHANARDVELKMPYLKSAQNLTIRDTSSIYLPNLQYVQSSFQIIENLITSLDVSNLQYVGGTLGIIENQHLVKANFNNVTEVQGGLMVAHNNKLDKINFFQSLRQIGGAIHFEGKFSETSFQNLKLVKGSAFIKSSSENLDCGQWITSTNGRSIIRGGKVKCSSARKSSFVNIDKEGVVLDSIENDNVDFEEESDTFGENMKSGSKTATKKSKFSRKMSNSATSLKVSKSCTVISVFLVIVRLIT
ncbi:hypothetical protein C6P45_004814 [Maudiozyma exigua]|uniref:Receptor L-domain domain-containing protein n=1 Tax=Maudiozyma exigua TaxID=34358 RepID=A0A9P6WC61_MAUEX|nr:hypothetical protein C6P45_004814 [Kazachstania exigua]